MGTYRNRRLRASVREHVADAIIGVTIGAIATVVLYLITVAVVLAVR